MTLPHIADTPETDPSPSAGVNVSGGRARHLPQPYEVEEPKGLHEFSSKLFKGGYIRDYIGEYCRGY